MSTEQIIKKDADQKIDSKAAKKDFVVGKLNMDTESKFHGFNETITGKDLKNFNKTAIYCKKNAKKVKEEPEREEGEIVSESDGDGEENDSNNSEDDDVVVGTNGLNEEVNCAAVGNVIDSNDKVLEVSAKKTVQQKIIQVSSPNADDVIDLSVSQEDINLIEANEDFVYHGYEKGKIICYNRDGSINQICKSPIIKLIKHDNWKNVENYEKEKENLRKEQQKIEKIENLTCIPKVTDESKFSQKIVDLKKNEIIELEDSDDTEEGEIRSPPTNSERMEFCLYEAKILKISEESNVEQKSLSVERNVDSTVKAYSAEVFEKNVNPVEKDHNNHDNSSTNDREKPSNADEILLNNTASDIVKQEENEVDVLNIKANIATFGIYEDNKKLIDKNSSSQPTHPTKNNEILFNNAEEKDKINEAHRTSLLNVDDNVILKFKLENFCDNEKLRKVPEVIEKEIIKAAKDVNTKQIVVDNSTEGFDTVSDAYIPITNTTTTATNDNQLNDKSKGEDMNLCINQGTTNESIKKSNEKTLEEPTTTTTTTADPKSKDFCSNEASTSKAANSSNIYSINQDNLMNKTTTMMKDNIDDIDDKPISFFGTNLLFTSPDQVTIRSVRPDQSPSPRLYRKEKSYTKRSKPYEKPKIETITREPKKIHLHNVPRQPYCPFTTKARISPYLITLYDEQGRLRRNGADICDCGNEICVGCWYNCFECGSPKCGLSCRCNRQVFPDNWLLKHG